MDEARILGLIPARAGSKGVVGKNSLPLAGRSLVERAVDTAHASGVVARLVVSTDSRAIAQHAERLGAEVPFLRPAELASDRASMIDVALHALEMLERNEGWVPDALLLLQPTSPLRTPEHLVRATKLFRRGDSVCSVVALPKTDCPHAVMRIDGGYMKFFMPDGARYHRRQDIPPAWRREGTVYLARTTVIREQRTFYGPRCVPMILGAEESLSIDDPEDWREAERRLLQRDSEPARPTS